MPDVLRQVGQYWDADAATYDHSASHHPRTDAELDAWRGALARLLPAAPSRVLDVGAGTGFVSLLAAGLGHHVTAIDLSGGMLGQLQSKAADAGLTIEVVQTPAHEPPPGPFDAVVERHVTWTLPDPVGAMAAWRSVAPNGRLILLEGCWGAAAAPLERQRARLRAVAGRLRRIPPNHHAQYDPELRDALPFGGGTPPAALRAAVLAAGWQGAEVQWLTDVDRATARGRPWPDRLLSVTPRFAITAR
jgi:SAM-dependent methyltransferase